MRGIEDRRLQRMIAYLCMAGGAYALFVGAPLISRIRPTWPPNLGGESLMALAWGVLAMVAGCQILYRVRKKDR